MSESIFTMYKNLGLLTQQMLDAARNDEWDVLIEAERKREAQVERIAAQDGLLAMTVAEQEKTSETIQNILIADEEIKALTATWMGELQEMLGSIGTEKKLQQTYEVP